MKNHFRRKRRYRGFELGIIADVPSNILNDRTDRRKRKHVGLGAGVECVASNLRATPSQPEREPTALETGVTGQKNTSSLPSFHHVFQGALPPAHSSSSRCLSRGVSIAAACKNHCFHLRLPLLSLPRSSSEHGTLSALTELVGTIHIGATGAPK